MTATLAADQMRLAEFYEDRLQRILGFAIDAHTSTPKTPEKAFRKWSPGATPYWTHPATIGLLATHEDGLPVETRITLVVGLVLHDVVEDTTSPIPDGITLPAERKLVEELTFPGGMEEEMAKVWDRLPLARLAKLHDKTHNLLNPLDAGEGFRRTKRYLPYVERLIEDVERHYGHLNIVMIARGVVQGTYRRIRA